MLFLNPHVQDKIGSGKDGGNQVAVFLYVRLPCDDSSDAASPDAHFAIDILYNNVIIIIKKGESRI